VIITASVALVRLAGGPEAARDTFGAHLNGVLARSGLGDEKPGSASTALMP
jgi:hypothetical protein